MPFASLNFSSGLVPTKEIYQNPYDQIVIKDDTILNIHAFGLFTETLKDKVINASPFSNRLEAYLRFAGIPYNMVVEPKAKSAPRGKLPWIDIDGVKLADGGLIIDFLKRHYRDIDASLTPRERAHGRMLSSMLTDHLYWVTLYYEFVDDAGSTFLMKASYGEDDPTEFTVSLRHDLYNVESNEATMKQIASVVSHTVGLGGDTQSWSYEEASQKWSPSFVIFAATNERITAEKARRELGWNPQMPSILEEMEHGSYRQLLAA